MAPGNINGQFSIISQLPELRATVVAIVMMQLLAQLKTGSVLTVRSCLQVQEYHIKEGRKRKFRQCGCNLGSYFQHKRLSNCRVKLKTVSGAPLCVAGQINLKVQGKNGKMRCLVLLVGNPNLGSSFITLLGRSWLDALFPSWRQQW
ncbi:hypothetical protein PR048_001674 [Dryococelus australis]|uniref:Uncharacterized protein n=1 Tax=Dryococelus australis TaxID=614101 RepID=A0ABQ9II05_9NEOP|nr:hypothetical protein PR048_001674 [Dryococelus australis]